MGLIDCKAIREEILNEVKSQLAELKGTPRLCIVTIGNDDASKVYVRNKIKKLDKCPTCKLSAVGSVPI